MKVVAGEPYTWPVAAPRRVENFVDLAHFALVHDGTLGRRDEPVRRSRSCAGRPASWLRLRPAGVPTIRRPPLCSARAPTACRCPARVDIEFLYPDGRRRRLWMTASPLDDATCRSFWSSCRTDDLAGDDRDHLAFQAVSGRGRAGGVQPGARRVLLDPGDELSVRTDKVSIEYRRWLRELATAALAGPAAYAAAIGVDAPAPADRNGGRPGRPGRRTAV